MKKKITAMLLAICCISSTCTVYADDSTSAGDISAMASEIVAQAAVRAEEYQELKKEESI